MAKSCQWCEKPISTMFGYDNILVVTDKPTMTYFFDNWGCLIKWIKECHPEFKVI